MNVFPLSALLLFSLVIPLMMQYRILPIQGTPFILFGIIFFVLTMLVVLTTVPELIRIRMLQSKRTITGLFVSVIVGVFLLLTLTAVFDRSKTAPVFGVHDIILQQESAMRYILVGKNPYKETYFGTQLEEWHYAEDGRDAINPALYHFVMPPWYLLFPFFFYFTSIPLVGFFDSRMALIFCSVGLLGLLYVWFKNKGYALLAMMLTAFSPATIHYLIEGRSDMFALSWFILSIILAKKHLLFSSISFGLAVLSKQTIWFAIPFYFLYVYLLNKKNVQKSFLTVVVFLGTILVLCIPFLLWDAQAFISSTILYLSGGTEFSYPISGYGLGMILLDLHLIPNSHAYYPFIVWQLAAGIPTLCIMLALLKKRTTPSILLIGYGITLLSFWYTSRYFNNSHISFIASIFVLGILHYLDEKELA